MLGMLLNKQNFSFSLLQCLELLSCVLLSGFWPVLINDFVKHMNRFVLEAFTDATSLKLNVVK